MLQGYPRLHYYAPSIGDALIEASYAATLHGLLAVRGDSQSTEPHQHLADLTARLPGAAAGIVVSGPETPFAIRFGTACRSNDRLYGDFTGRKIASQTELRDP